MDSISSQQFQQLLSLAFSWVERQQACILQNGTCLSESQISDAKLAPVSFPEKIRLLKVECMPQPQYPVLRSIAQEIGLLSGGTAGLALGYGIFLRSDCWENRRLVVHEFAHVAQYERLGGIRQFLERYLHECLSVVDYKDAPLEKEAHKTAERICGQSA